MEALAVGHNWRNRFEDQLHLVYKEWLLKKVTDEFAKGAKVEEFLGGASGILGEQLAVLEKQKEPIKKAILANNAAKELVRQVESKTIRTVHFIFNHKQKVKMEPFTRKYDQLLKGSLKQFEEDERTKFATYLENIESEQIEGGNDEWNVLQHNPVVFGNSSFFTCELTNLSRVLFGVADNPFFKSLKSKYYPEVVVMNMKGLIKARVNPQNRNYERQGVKALAFEEDFRELKLKINDDKRISINLNQLIKKKEVKANASALSNKVGPKGKMILLTVKIAAEAMRATAGYERAWYRLVNEETSQTIDYKLIKDVNLPDNPAGAPPEEGGEEGASSGQSKAYFTYVAGRIFFDYNGSGRWVYERYNHCFSSDKFEKDGGEIAQSLCTMYQQSEEELIKNEKDIKKSRKAVMDAQEEAKQAAIAAASKKKPAAGTKPSKKEATPVEEKQDHPTGPPPKRELDLNKPLDFAEALRDKVPRPFIFGPVEFSGLDH